MFGSRDPKDWIDQHGNQIPYGCHHEQPCTREHPGWPRWDEPVKYELQEAKHSLRRWLREWWDKYGPVFHFGNCHDRSCCDCW